MKKNILFLLLSLLCLGGCKKKDITPRITASQTALYFSDWGTAPQTLTYSTVDAVSVAVSSVSTGWTPVVDQATNTLTVTPPASADLGYDRSGIVILTALSKDSVSSSVTIYLYVCDVDQFDEPANCHIATRANTRYRFLPKRGDGSAVEASSAKLLWQSGYGLVDNVALETDGAISFFVGETEKGTCPDGNAVIGACDASGNVVWSWHIWVASNSPIDEAVTYANGQSYMARNLGAYTNSNGSHDTQKILDSYGLYYQWGRKDPFLRPASYECAGGEDEVVVDEQGAYVTFTTEQTSASVGTMEYATAHPTTFIANAAAIAEGGDGVGDWLATPNNTLWGDGSTKSVNDPCPAGWRVPTAQEWSVLTLSAEQDATPLSEARKQYGWFLTDGSNQYFYLGAGYHRYNDGVLQNMNYKEDVYPSQPEPWEGYYWSSTPSGNLASCLFFDLTTTRLANKFNNNLASRRANAMQVRCVKE